MAKKKINKTNEPFDDAFNLFAVIALYPVDLAARVKYYPISIALVVTLATIWCIPIFFIGSVVSTMIGLFTIIKTLIKKRLCTR